MAHGVQLIRKTRRIDVSGACGLNFAAVTDGSCCIELGHRRGRCGSLLSLPCRISTVCLLKYDIAGRVFAICRQTPAGRAGKAALLPWNLPQAPDVSS